LDMAPPPPTKNLGWTPETSFADLVTEMAAADLAEARAEMR